MKNVMMAVLVIVIHAKRFEFSPNEVHLKRGQPVTIQLVSDDRPHGLSSKPLQIELDGNDEVTITPTVAGTFKAICDHYCGSGHGNMKLTFVVED
jgi:cytochrome c oxidase subunit 2